MNSKLPDSIMRRRLKLWKRIEKQLKSGEIEFPLLPSVSSWVKKIAGGQELSVHDLHKVIVSDQVIASRVLRMANSQIFPVREPIASINHAIMRLGYRNIANMVLASVLYTEMMGSDCYGKNSYKLWQHSVSCGLICRVIAAIVDKDTEEALTVGLIHDIGKLFFYQEKIFSKVELGISDREFKEFIRIFHPLAGSILTESWNFPRKVSDAIRFHHKVDRAGNAKDLASIVNLGNLICHSHGMGVESRKVDIYNCKSAKFLGMQEFKIKALNEAAADAFTISSEIFQFD